MTTIVLAVALGVLAGVLAGLFGVGGGILFVPTLVLVLDYAQLDAEATSLLAILPAAVAGGLRQFRYGHIRWRTALVVGVVAIVGVEAGILVAERIAEEDLRRLFGLLLLGVSAQIVWRARRRESTG